MPKNYTVISKPYNLFFGDEEITAITKLLNDYGFVIKPCRSDAVILSDDIPDSSSVWKEINQVIRVKHTRAFDTYNAPICIGDSLLINVHGVLKIAQVFMGSKPKILGGTESPVAVIDDSIWKVYARGVNKRVFVGNFPVICKI